MDYSHTVFCDIIGWFRKRRCVFCDLNYSESGKELSRVAVGAYSGYQWYYFHDYCLKTVSNSPEEYSPFVDLANEIETEIDRFNKESMESKDIDLLKKRMAKTYK